MSPRMSPQASDNLAGAFPARVRVGALDYTVRYWSPQASDNTRAIGLCDRSTCTILIRSGMVPQKEAEVLIHEIFHAAWDGAGLAMEDDHPEERVVNALGYQWLQILRDNPNLFDYVLRVFDGATLPLGKIRGKAA